MKPKLYSTAEAAAYLGVHLETFKYHLYDKRHIAPDYTVGRELAFLQSTLDDFLSQHQSHGLTIQEASEYLGVTVSVIRYHLYTSRRLKPDAKRGKQMVFLPETLDQLRRR